jgi:hypothetical protein
MEWLIGIAIVGFLYYRFVIVKGGNIKFWKVAHANSEETYAFFKSNPAFVVFDTEPAGGYRANLPSGEWDGPFKLPVESQKRVIVIYGRSPDYQVAQDKYIGGINR